MTKNNKSTKKDENDIFKKISIDYLKRQIIKSALYTYNNNKLNEKELKTFLVYLDKRIKQNKSSNNLNNRIEKLFNYIVGLYSDYREFIDIIADNDDEVNA